jgi:RNA polymerase sigma-70 factor (ECF subfamily)
MFKAYDSFGGWLRTITNRTAVDYLRKMRERQLTLGEADWRLTTEEPSSAEDDLVNRLTYEGLLAEFDKLPEVTRKIFRLFYENNMTVEEIGTALNIPTGTIKSTLSRTRKRIQKQLKI